LYQGEETKGRHPPAFLRYMGSRLHAEIGCRKVYAGEHLSDKKFPCFYHDLYRTLCLVQIVSLWSFSIGVRIIFTTNELVDRIRNFKSNVSRFNKTKNQQNSPQATFFMKRNVPQARLMQQIVPQAKFCDLVLMRTLSYWCSIYFIFHKSKLRIFFF